MIVVELAFESVQHVGDFGKAGLLERLTRLDGAVATPTDEDDRPVRMVRPGDLLHLADEMRVHLPIGASVRLDMQRAFRVADEEVFHFASAVHEERLWRVLQILVGFARGKVFHARAGLRKMTQYIAPRAPEPPRAYRELAAPAPARGAPEMMDPARDPANRHAERI